MLDAYLYDVYSIILRCHRRGPPAPVEAYI